MIGLISGRNVPRGYQYQQVGTQVPLERSIDRSLAAFRYGAISDVRPKVGTTLQARDTSTKCFVSSKLGHYARQQGDF